MYCWKNKEMKYLIVLSDGSYISLAPFTAIITLGIKNKQTKKQKHGNSEPIISGLTCPTLICDKLHNILIWSQTKYLVSNSCKSWAFLVTTSEATTV